MPLNLPCGWLTLCSFATLECREASQNKLFGKRPPQWSATMSLLDFPMSTFGFFIKLFLQIWIRVRMRFFSLRTHRSLWNCDMKTLIFERSVRGRRLKKPVAINVPENQSEAEKKTNCVTPKEDSRVPNPFGYGDGQPRAHVQLALRVMRPAPIWGWVR